MDSFRTEDTFQIGYNMGLNAKKGEVYCLSGDLGVGKTVFTQGFAKGLGIEDAVNSPTFTIVQQYEGSKMPFYHFDVYRIAEADEMYEIGYDEYIDGDGVCVIEWPQLIDEILPKNRYNITITKNYNEHDDYREIVIEKV